MTFSLVRPPPELQGGAGIAAPLTEGAKDVHLPNVDLHLCRVLLCLLQLDNYYPVLLAVPPPIVINHKVVNCVAMLENCGSSRAFPLDAHHLRCSPNTLVLGSYFLGKHLLSNVVVSDNAIVGGGVGVPYNRSQDLLGVAQQIDGALPRDGHSI